MRRLVSDTLGQLSGADREVLTLSAWYELTGDEAAQALGCSRSAYGVRLHRARRRVAQVPDEAMHARSRCNRCWVREPAWRARPIRAERPSVWGRVQSRASLAMPARIHTALLGFFPDALLRKVRFTSAKIVSKPTNGSLHKIAHLEFRYKPRRGFKGNDAFVLSVCGQTEKGKGCSTLHYDAVVE